MRRVKSQHLFVAVSMGASGDDAAVTRGGRITAAIWEGVAVVVVVGVVAAAGYGEMLGPSSCYRPTCWPDGLVSSPR